MTTIQTEDAAIDTTPRSQWARALLSVVTEDVMSAAEAITAGCALTHRAIPRSGLMLMRMTESVFNEDYYLGELPISSAWVELTDTSGRKAEGSAQIMDDRQELALAIAVCDAALANRMAGWEGVAALVRKGMDLIEQEHRVRRAMLAKTRVDFAIVSEDADENA